MLASVCMREDGCCGSGSGASLDSGSNLGLGSGSRRADFGALPAGLLLLVLLLHFGSDGTRLQHGGLEGPARQPGQVDGDG